jgi:hypothetical protein
MMSLRRTCMCRYSVNATHDRLDAMTHGVTLRFVLYDNSINAEYC